MKGIFRDYFTFNKRERNGVFILLLIIATMVLYLNISSHFVEPEQVDFTAFEKEIAQFNAELNASSDSAEFSEGKHASLFVPTPSEIYSGERFPFDPNDLSDNDWQRLGLTMKQIRSIKNYESKGGKFKTKQDVKKMYCIKKELFNALEPYIQIPAQPSFFKDGKVERSEVDVRVPVLAVVELNSADSAMLTSIKGI